MPQQNAKSLFDKYQSGQCSPEEQAIVENWLTFGEATGLDLSESELEQDLVELKQRIAAVPKKLVRLWPRIAAVAAAVTLIVLGVYFFNAPRHSDAGQNPALAMNDIAPGKNGATITLANGKVIQLSDAKTGVVVGSGLKYSDGAEILTPKELRSKTVQDEGQGGERNSMMLTANTAKGQTYQFTLPDGTKVWLNADSKLEFPSNFVNRKTRFVKLSGEGYFEVSKDKAHPFLVESRGQTVEVLGTHFNINSYSDESTVRTTLLEGSVSVNEVVLKPNEQSVLSSSNRLTVAKVDVNEVISWKDGYFRFYEVDLETFMTTIARWYDIEVVYEGGIDLYKDLAFGGSVSRSKNISEVLKILAQTGKVHYKITGKKVTITK